MNPRTRIPQIPTLLLALAATLALLAPAAAQGQERTVAATAEASLKVANDSAGFGLSVTGERRSRGAALRAVSGDLRSVIGAVQKVPGVGPGDVATKRITVRRALRSKRPMYRASEGIGVTLHQPRNAGKLAAAAVAAGATGISGPNYFVGDTESAFSKALSAAFDKAKAQASTLAIQAGATLGAVLSIDEGEGPELFPPAQPEPLGGTGSGQGASVPVRPGASTVAATVHVVFALQ
jgi:uncharacterized protein YggE